MLAEEAKMPDAFIAAAIVPDGNGGFKPCPDLLTKEELIAFLRIPQISKSRDCRNAVENLKRMYSLARIHLYSEPLHPRRAIVEPCSK